MSETSTIPLPADVPVMGIKYYDLDAIRALNRNFKGHDIQGIADGMTIHGMLDPIGMDDLTDENYDGNGRVEALIYLRDNGHKPPKRIVEQNGKWYVPVLTGVSFESEGQRVAAAAALNRLNEMGGYDEALMAETLNWLKELDHLAGTGYTPDDVAELLKKFDNSNDEKEDDTETNSGTGGGPGIQQTVTVSGARQTQLIFTTDEHQEFIRLNLELSKIFDTKDVTATVFEAMRRQSAIEKKKTANKKK